MTFKIGKAAFAGLFVFALAGCQPPQAEVDTGPKPQPLSVKPVTAPAPAPVAAPAPVKPVTPKPASVVTPNVDEGYGGDGASGGSGGGSGGSGGGSWG